MQIRTLLLGTLASLALADASPALRRRAESPSHAVGYITLSLPRASGNSPGTSGVGSAGGGRISTPMVGGGGIAAGSGSGSGPFSPQNDGGCVCHHDDHSYDDHGVNVSVPINIPLDLHEYVYPLSTTHLL
jgi:hypothetical protein